ncbi:DDE superfamily endonuclease [Aureococcus anophagefferens]|nr:DDE superfamily endonuclease [Aureococcus anophagefferens]
MALRYGARRRRRNAVAYGKHGKVLRWMIVRLMIDYDWKAPQIERRLSVQGRFRTISVATIRRIVKIWRETGDVATPREGTRRRQGSMLPQHWQALRTALHYSPDLFLDEMKTVLWLAFEVRYSIGVILATMKRHGYTRRVLKQLAERRDAEEERTFIDVYSSLPGEYFVFVDETRKDPRGLHRKFGYAVGTRTSASSFQRSSSYSATGVLSLQGAIGATSRPPRASALPRGVRLVYLPPYANNLNPIEEAFAQTKAWLIRYRDVASSEPEWALGRALESVSAADARGYFAHAGYDVPELHPAQELAAELGLDFS